MRKQLAIALLGWLASTAMPVSGWAETVMEKVARTGVLTAGTRTDAVPFAYVDDDQNWRGYSIEMLVLIRDQLEQELGREIALDLVAVTPEDRIEKVQNQDVDIVCGATSFTWNRERYVDFSISYAIAGTQLLVKNDSLLGTPESLQGKKIGVLAGTTNEQVMKLVQPNATLIPVANSPAGFAALEQGKIDGFAWDGILLKGLQQAQPNAAAYGVVPEKPYAIEGIACMVPEENSQFRDTVNFTLARFMQGYLMEDPRFVNIFDRWFGADGPIPLNHELVIDFFRDVIDAREQIPIEPASQ